MRQSFKLWGTAVWLVALLGATAMEVGAHPHGEPFMIGLAPQQDPAKVYHMMQPFLAYLEREVK